MATETEATPDGEERLAIPASASFSPKPWWSLLAATVVLGSIALIGSGPTGDGDLWWQMAYGKHLLANHTLVPDHTVFTWTPVTGDVIYCAWVSEIALYLIHRAAGLPGLFALRYLALLLPGLLMFALARKQKVARHPLLWLVFFAVYLASFATGGLLKPELFSFVFMGLAVGLWFLIKTSGAGSWRWSYAYPVLMLLWVNSHGGYIVGLTFLAVAIGGDLVNRLLAPDAALPVRVRRHLYPAAALTALAALVTPYGWRYVPAIIDTVIGRDPEDLRTILAYQTIFSPAAQDLHLVLYLVIMAGILLALVAGALRRGYLDFSLLLINALFIVLYVRYVRMSYFFALVFLFTAPYLLAQIGAGSRWPQRRVIFHLMGFAVVGTSLMLGGHQIAKRITEPGEAGWIGFGVSYLNPVAEAEYIHEHLSGLQLCNDYGSGGYLLWRLWPERKIMIDPRYFPFRSWFGSYVDMVRGRRVEYFLRTHPCEAWSLNLVNHTLLRWLIASDRWSPVFYGPSSAVFVASTVHRRLPPLEPAPSTADIKTVNRALKVIGFAMRVGDWRGTCTVLKEMETRFEGSRHAASLARARANFARIKPGRERACRKPETSS